MDNVYTKFGLTLSIRSRDIEYKPNSDVNQLRKTRIYNTNEDLTSCQMIVCIHFPNLQKMTLYNPNLDLVNDNMHTKFGLILSIHSQDIEKNPNYGEMTERE